MRILVCHNRYKYYGGEDTVYAAEVAMLRAHGHTVITYEDDNARIDSMSLAIAASKSIWSRETHLKLRKIIASEKPDIAHFHNTFLLISPSAYYACRDASIPVVQTLHNYRLLCPASTFMRNGTVCEACIKRSFDWPAIMHSCYRGSRLQSTNIALILYLHKIWKTWQECISGYIALTHFAKNKFIEGGIPSDKLYVKPNFIENTGSSNDVYSDDSYMLYVGRLSPEKGVETLIQAAAIVTDIPIKIVGDGPLKEQIRALIQAGELSNVELVGSLPHADVLRYLDKAEALVLPSLWYEAFPMTIVEAFSRRKPVIASYIGSMTEIVKDKDNGLHFRCGDRQDLAEKMRWAWDNKAELRLLGYKAFQDYMMHYTEKQNYNFLMGIYTAVMDSR